MNHRQYNQFLDNVSSTVAAYFHHVPDATEDKAFQVAFDALNGKAWSSDARAEARKIVKGCMRNHQRRQVA